jgi:hypothetical protein
MTGLKKEAVLLALHSNECVLQAIRLGYIHCKAILTSSNKSQQRWNRIELKV